jgi:hypothetical protein
MEATVAEKPKNNEESQATKDIKAIQSTAYDELPVLPETVRNQEVLQWFYRAVTENFTCLGGRKSPLYLRRSEHGLAIRIGNQWKLYRRGESIEFWRDAMEVYPELRESNWSTKRQQDLWNYFQAYAPQISFDNRRYFEMANCIMDGHNGGLDYEPERFLNYPTTEVHLLNTCQITSRARRGRCGTTKWTAISALSAIGRSGAQFLVNTVYFSPSDRAELGNPRLLRGWLRF